MNYPEIIVASHREAGLILASGHDPPVKAVISIGASGDSPCQGYLRVPIRIRLEFDDVAVGDRRLLSRATQTPKRKQIGPSPGVVKRIISFAQSIQDLDGALLCHCEAGVSRSTAAAVICLAVWSGAGNEYQAARQLLDQRPQSQPHRDMVNFADTALAREGKLCQAVEDVFADL